MADAFQLLLVDDDELDRIAVRRALRRTDLDYTVDEVQTVAAAVGELQERRYDCVILDYHLPDGDAFSLLRRAGELRSARPPIIILTGLGSESVAVELMKAGASDYLPKNELTPSRIAQSVRNAIRVWTSEAALHAAYEELERRVVERTAELERANEELEDEIRDRRRAEDRARHLLDQLAHVARLSTLGEMAAGLAHELHQPLGAIANYANGSVERLRAGTAGQEVLIEVFEKVAAQAERAGQIIRRLRAFVTDREAEKIATDVNELMAEVADLEAVEARQSEVVMHLELGEALPRVLADPIQIQQVILNLLRNGIEAMEATTPEARRLSLRTSRGRDGTVAVEISDRGPGCGSEELERLFDAFVTTKEHGMGLGLPISRSIVEAHGGELWAAPNPEGGLSFHFTLPILEEENHGEA